MPICLSIPSVAYQAATKLVLDTDDYHYEATFDPNRISEARLRELLPFSPYVNLGDGWKVEGIPLLIVFEDSPDLRDKSLSATGLEICITGDPRYSPCGRRTVSDPNFFKNAQINVAGNFRALEAVDRLQVPSELLPILKHYRDSLAFHGILEQRRLAYLRTADMRELSSPIGAIDPTQLCGQELRELQEATTIQQRYKLSLYRWYNCANREWLQRSSGYPIQAWRSFLGAYGITERYEEKAVD